MGCAQRQYNADDLVVQRLPRVGELNSSTVVEGDPEIVWQRLVARLTESPLFITDIDRSSHLITVDFSAPDPGDYLDCGTAEGEYVQRGDTTQTHLRLAEGGRIEWGLQTRTQTGVEFETRGSLVLTAQLSGGVNIYVGPSVAGTEVKANARYLLRITQDGARVARGQRSDLGLNEAYAFTTHGREQYRTSSPVISMLRCTPTGALEQQILDMARPGRGGA